MGIGLYTEEAVIGDIGSQHEQLEYPRRRKPNQLLWNNDFTKATKIGSNGLFKIDEKISIVLG